MLKEIQDWFGLSPQEQSLGLGHGHAGGKGHGQPMPITMSPDDAIRRFGDEVG